MTKHHYEVSVAELKQDGEQTTPVSRLQFEFLSHEDLLEILAKIQQKQILSDEESMRFCVGLKLFSSVLLENRNHPLFAEFVPHFGAFMKNLKK